MLRRKNSWWWVGQCVAQNGVHSMSVPRQRTGFAMVLALATVVLQCFADPDHVFTPLRCIGFVLLVVATLGTVAEWWWLLWLGHFALATVYAVELYMGATCSWVRMALLGVQVAGGCVSIWVEPGDHIRLEDALYEMV